MTAGSVSRVQEVPITTLPPERFRNVLAGDELEKFESAMERGRSLLGSRTAWNVNSTARGGGVAEMLRSLMGYARGADLDTRWLVIDGDEEFFRVTKRLHNRLHGARGDGGALDDEAREAYERRCDSNAEELMKRVGDDDVVLLHDPQTAGIVPRLADAGVPVVWRSHVGLDRPNDETREAWAFLRPYVEPADAYVFSREAFAWEGLDADRTVVIAPSIDAFSPKNHAMSFTSIVAVLGAAGLAEGGGDRHPRAVFERCDRSTGVVEHRAEMIEDEPLRLDVPLIAQVSRWDRLKDPLGVLSGFAEHVDPGGEPHLVLAGPDVQAVADDPEGAEVLDEVEAAWCDLPPAVRRRVHLALLPMDDPDENAVMVNALQRRADVVVQKSIAEGFGLTVAEAMWKGRPVVASRVGGIQDQIEDGRTGRLVAPDDPREFGDAVTALLADPHTAERLGEAAQIRVRNHFLGPRHLSQYVDLLERVLTG
jgi:trehalose synthase